MIAGQSKSLTVSSIRNGHHRAGCYVPSSNRFRVAARGIRPTVCQAGGGCFRTSVSGAKTLPSRLGGLTRSLRKKYPLDHHPFCVNDYFFQDEIGRSRSRCEGRMLQLPRKSLSCACPVSHNLLTGHLQSSRASRHTRAWVRCCGSWVSGTPQPRPARDRECTGGRAGKCEGHHEPKRGEWAKAPWDG